MKRIVLISCVSMKRDQAAPAQDLYISPLFMFARKYAEKLQPDAWFILSAEYGLLKPIQRIAPYNKTLNTMKSPEIKRWAERVLKELRKVADLENDEFIFLAGMKYRKHLIPHLHHTHIPLKGLGIGKQLQFLKHRT